jgi:hypothetical protein
MWAWLGVDLDVSERRVLEPVGEQCLLAEDLDGGIGGREPAGQDEQQAGRGPANRDVGFAVAALDGDAGRRTCDQPPWSRRSGSWRRNRGAAAFGSLPPTTTLMRCELGDWMQTHTEQARRANQ